MKKRNIKKSELKQMAQIKKALGGDDFKGLSSTATKSGGTTLTLKNFEKAVKYIGSKEYAKKEIERSQWIYRGQMIVNLALVQGIISENEAMHLSWSIGINGALIVSPKMYKRLEKVKLIERDVLNSTKETKEKR